MVDGDGTIPTIRDKTKCELIGTFQETALAIGGGLPITQNVVPNETINTLKMTTSSNDPGITVSGTASVTNPNTGAVTISPYATEAVASELQSSRESGAPFITREFPGLEKR
jgi:hypothetical protein